MVSQAVYEKLQEKARSRGITSYKEIALLTGIDTSDRHFAIRVGELLDQVNHAEYAAGRPLLSAVVMGQDSDMPGEGFFGCASRLGRYSGGDKLAYWLDELNRVYGYWSHH